MACSLPAGLRTKAVACATLFASALLAPVVLEAQDANRYILATRRSGAIEIIDPESLATLGRIHFDLPSESVGLNGISASADGTTLYVEGPIPNMLTAVACFIPSISPRCKRSRSQALEEQLPADASSLRMALRIRSHRQAAVRRALPAEQWTSTIPRRASLCVTSRPRV